MRLLLDTHVFLWWRANSPHLEGNARRAMAEAEQVFISAASAWEVAIKSALGKIRLPDAFAAGVEASGMKELKVDLEHAAELGRLPFHHRDPFDRMLVAQARTEGLALVTHDRSFEPYEVALVWV